MALLLGGDISLSVGTVGPVTAHIDPGQSVHPECAPPGVWAGPDPGLTVVATVPSDLAHTDCPHHGALVQAGMRTSQPGNSAGPAGLPLLRVSLVGQLGASLSLKPVPGLLQISHN